MKNKTIFIGLVIFSAGIGAGYLIGVKRVKELYKIDLAEVKDFYADKIEGMGVMDADFNPEDMIIEASEDDEDDREIEEYFEKALQYSAANAEGPRGKGRPIINYNKPPLIADYGKLDNEEEYDEDDEPDEEYEADLEARADEFAQRKNENKSNGQPYVIDFTEFEDGPDDYERQTLYYYSGDRTLCEDDDSRVEDEEELVGLDYEDVLETQTNAWVRNDTLLTLYEIHRISGSYAVEVTNAQETPREREYRILGRRKQGLDN